MITTTATRVSAFLSVPTRPSNVSRATVKQVIFIAKHPTPCTLQPGKSTPSITKLRPFLPFASTSSSPALEDEEDQEERGDFSPSDTDGLSALSQLPQPPTSLRGCRACGKEEIEMGCNGEGRIQGGIATVPGFGWWPIKAYRPCPSFVATGGRYRRTGQSMDDIGFGGGGREASAGEDIKSQSSMKRQGPRKIKG